MDFISFEKCNKLIERNELGKSLAKIVVVAVVVLDVATQKLEIFGSSFAVFSFVFEIL